MNNTLAERVLSCMKEKGITNAELALACGVAPPTSYYWTTGRTKKIKTDPLLRAAKLFGVSPDWLSSNTGPKYLPEPNSQHTTNEPHAVYALPKTKTDAQEAEVIELFHRLDAIGKAEFLGYMRGFVEGRRPHSYGRASKVAG